jgi:hypothetical protein
MITDNQKSTIKEEYTAMCARPVGGWGIDYDNESGYFGKTAPGDLLKIPNVPLSQLPIPTEKIEDGPGLPSNPPIDVNIDVWGGKRKYSYRVLTPGNITYTLVGGGSGGTGAAAARDAQNSQTTRAAAGRSANGGPTILWVNKTRQNGANGGVGVNGPDTGEVNGNTWSGAKEVYKDGFPGNDGAPAEGSFDVSAGDIITIEVGWGGGGSGGAANNDGGGYVSSGSATTTLGSEGISKDVPGKTAANASRGGMGAMHDLIFLLSEYTSDLQKGESSPNVGGATAASGGPTKGAGGSAGDEYATGGMYASGGGGGAAGGFTLKSTTAALEETTVP